MSSSQAYQDDHGRTVYFRGVQLELYEGRPLLIGSQCADDLAREISGRIKRFS